MFLFISYNIIFTSKILLVEVISSIVVSVSVNTFSLAFAFLKREL
jgi:hypothetical protein